MVYCFRNIMKWLPVLFNINDVINIAKEAGKEILKIYRQDDIEVCFKTKDHSPVTIADLNSHNIICKKLKEISDYPIFSEEEIVPYEEREHWKLFWLVDPLDGTKDFLVKNGEFTVNIALIENGKPILGIVHIPVLKDTYYAQLGKGAYKNGIKICNSSSRKELIGADSNFHSTVAMKNFFEKYHINDIRKIGSTIKICKLAEGIIDVYPRLNETKEWDTAAVHIIANEAGCKLIDLETKKELVYNKKNYRNNFFIACRNNLEFEELKL